MSVGRFLEPLSFANRSNVHIRSALSPPFAIILCVLAVSLSTANLAGTVALVLFALSEVFQPNPYMSFITAAACAYIGFSGQLRHMQREIKMLSASLMRKKNSQPSEFSATAQQELGDGGLKQLHGRQDEYKSPKYTVKISAVTD